MSTIIIITPPTKPKVQPQGAPIAPVPVDGMAYEVPDGMSEADALRYIADQIE